MALRSCLFVSTLLFSLGEFRVHPYILLCDKVIVFSGLSHAQLCPSGAFTYSESNCLSLTSSSTPSYENASASCQAIDGASLVLISSEGELYAVRAYTRSLGVKDGQYWIGYRYSSANLIDVNDNAAPSFIVSAVVGGPSPANNVCVALTQNEVLVRVMCDQPLDGHICQYTINGK